MDEYKKYEPIFGAWYLNKIIGRGSFGKVFEITREEYGTIYRSALKIISVPQDDDDLKTRMSEGTDIETVSEYYEGILKEIINENEIMAKLKGNSNIVSYEDHQVIPHGDDVGYDILIRMELLTPLVDRMVEKRLDEKEVVKLGIDMCKALELCHKKNIIHRDIKPQNIFISDNGDFKLGDFGIARTMEKTTGGMSKKGTYKYMAPEVFRGEHYDSTVDIYSLGIVLYSLLNGNRGPFLPPPPAKVTHNDEEEARMRRFRGEPFPAPRDAGPMLAYIIQKASAADPAQRYHTAEQMRRDLESYMSNYSGQPYYAQATADSERTLLDNNFRAESQDSIEQMPRGVQKARSKKSSGSKIIIPIAAVCVVLIVAAAALAFIHRSGTSEVDLSELMEAPVISGYEGAGFLDDIKIDDDKRLDFLAGIRNDDKRSKAAAMLDTVVYEADTDSELSNGDYISIHAAYDSDLCEEAGLKVVGTDYTVMVDKLSELPGYLKDAVQYNGHYYKVVDAGIYWTQAKNACEDQNGHLATIMDADEQKFIVDLIEEKGKLYHYWLGASDAGREGDWKWITGENVPLPGEKGFHNWCGNQPNNQTAYESEGQDYMEIQMTEGDQGPEEYATWTDIGNSGEAGTQFYGYPDYNETRYYGYICEWDME